MKILLKNIFVSQLIQFSVPLPLTLARQDFSLAGSFPNDYENIQSSIWETQKQHTFAAGNCGDVSGPRPYIKHDGLLNPRNEEVGALANN